MVKIWARFLQNKFHHFNIHNNNHIELKVHSRLVPVFFSAKFIHFEKKRALLFKFYRFDRIIQITYVNFYGRFPLISLIKFNLFTSIEEENWQTLTAKCLQTIFHSLLNQNIILSARS